jgi:predicted esterase
MAEVEAMAAQIIRVADTIASQRAVTRTLVLGYSQGGHVAWLLAATGRFDVVLPVSGALAPGYQPPPPTGTTTIRALHGEDDRTLPATAGAATFRAFSTAGYKGDFSRVKAGHSLTTLGKHVAPLLTASLGNPDPKARHPPGLSMPQLRGR